MKYPMQNKGMAFIRYAMALLFIWFGYQQLAHTKAWVLFLPEFTSKLPISPELFVQMNGGMELVFGICMAIGIFTRFVSLILGLHLLAIAYTVGTDVDLALGIRDAGLAAAALGVAMNTPDECTLDAKRKKSKMANPASTPETKQV